MIIDVAVWNPDVTGIEMKSTKNPENPLKFYWFICEIERDNFNVHPSLVLLKLVQSFENLVYTVYLTFYKMSSCLLKLKVK